MKKFVYLLFIYILFTIIPVIAADEELLFMFDASLSMSDDFYGTPKYQIAVREVKSMLDKLGPQHKVGLRTIGIILDSSVLKYLQNPDEMCKATQLTVPIRPNSASFVKSSLDNIVPLGTTPLEYTLRLSLDSDFTRSVPLKHIVLITDGADSCGGDPCRYARAAMMQRSDVKIDIIAIGVNDIEVQQLKCIADAAKGNVFLVSNPKDIENAVNTIYSNINTLPVTPSVNYQTNSIKTEINNFPTGSVKYKNYHFETFD